MLCGGHLKAISSAQDIIMENKFGKYISKIPSMSLKG